MASHIPVVRPSDNLSVLLGLQVPPSVNHTTTAGMLPTNPVSSAKTEKNKAKKRKRNAKALALKDGTNVEEAHHGEPNTPVRLEQESSPKKKAKTKQETMEENIDEEPDEQRKRLEALGKRTLELQGYVNQIQDAVTIGMYRLRDLMDDMAAATAALKTADE